MTDEAGVFRYCPWCASPLAARMEIEDGGPKERQRCTACTFTHWNNPTPVLAAVVQCVDREGRLLLARNAAWTSSRMFGLITGFMEAGESPEQGVQREVMEETSLQVDAMSLIGVYDFQRKNQLLIAYHVQARGEIRLSPELAEYKLYAPTDVMCWPAGTGYALADWLRAQGHEPRFFDWSRPSSEPSSSKEPAAS
jgi:NAD+ diphosphatase